MGKEKKGKKEEKMENGRGGGGVVGVKCNVYKFWGKI